MEVTLHDTNKHVCVDDRNEWPLDRMCLQCDVTKKNREDYSSPPREGAYVYGLYMEGARWDTQVRHLSPPRRLFVSVILFIWILCVCLDTFVVSQKLFTRPQVGNLEPRATD